jgi:hypothetical protein
MNLLHKLGLDGAIAYTFLARAMGIVGSTGTVLLIAHSLSPVEQGFYYTLLSLVSLQLVFELGFSFVLQQMAAHECVHLELSADGSIRGNAKAHARLASILQITVRWYTIAALVMVTLLAPCGFLFFAAHKGENVQWQAPWLFAVCASALGLWATPLYSFLEGCGEVKAVAAMRLCQSIAAAVMAWSALLAHRGLYAPALVIIGQTTAGLFFVAQHGRFVRGLLLHRSMLARVDWAKEIWPFQWRIAVSWLCSYFTAQAFIPILFWRRGAVEAGQMGMSLSITGYMIVLVLAWTSTKATPFGQLIARREYEELDKFFQRSLGQSLIVFALIALLALAAVAGLGAKLPAIAHRMVPFNIFVLLVLAACANCVVQSLATLLRAFKSEPFLVQSLVVAALTLGLASISAARWGLLGTAISYVIATGGVALPSALRIYARTRRAYLKANEIGLIAHGEAA